MSDEDSQNHQQIIRNKQQAQRKFGCPCGKWYLSYPALFTHVKQKHQGKPPGNLIKPKTDKARGRPRLPTTNIQEDISIVQYNCYEELMRVLQNKRINYNDNFQSSEGHQTCQDMATQFFRMMPDEGDQKVILTCFLNYIKFFVKKKYDEAYWQSNRPTDIIDISNEIVRDLQNNQQMFPLQKQILIDLLYVLFRWMYKNKWTDHKLVRRSSSQIESNKQNHKH